MNGIFSKISILLSASSLCFAASVDSEIHSIAQTDSMAVSDSCKVKEPAPCGYDQRVQIGGNYAYCWITPEGSDTVSGNLGGAQGIYEYRPVGSIYAGAAFTYRIGTTENDAGTRELQDFNPQARLGYTFNKQNFVDRFSLFTGVGARYMAETVTVGSASLDFDYTTFYVPVGFSLERAVTDCFLIGCNFQWMPQVFPMVRIDLLDGAEWDLTYQLLDFFVEVPLTFTTCDRRFALSISPFFETWRDGESTAETLTHLTLSLPGNKYLFAGVNVNLGFLF